MNTFLKQFQMLHNLYKTGLELREFKLNSSPIIPLLKMNTQKGELRKAVLKPPVVIQSLNNNVSIPKANILMNKADPSKKY